MVNLSKLSPMPNALINETSPYLLQHADNPVQWYPWGSAALERAKAEDKPILLSIGYSACHWCHVMAHESFESPDTAALMNELFINIKVDREERPDIDKIYQTAQHLLTQRPGGWPLTMFLTPEDQMPFFGGTYFPPQDRYGMPGFPELLQRVAAYYRDERHSISQQNASLGEAFKRMQEQTVTVPQRSPDMTPLHTSIEELTRSYDTQYGGFGGAPKFPTPTNIERLLHHQEMFANGREVLSMALHTLTSMARGGIYDHLGGGFCRYSVDGHWSIPHFEKMLYDNGPLLALYATAFHLSGDPRYQQTAVETGEWMIREMQSPEGGYYSSLDADSEGVEGKYYIWTPAEVESALTAEEYRCLAARFGLDGQPNFEDYWHLELQVEEAEIAARHGMEQQQVAARIDSGRRKLLAVRERRVRPGRDEKILTSWNALAIRGMGRAAALLGRMDFLDSATASLEFIRDHLWRDGRLLATCKDGRAHLNAYLDDYAYLLAAVLDLLAVRWNGAWLRFAQSLADCLLELFYDGEHGGFYFTSHDHERLIQRRKDYMDDALPSGNGVAALALSRLGHLINEPRYLEAADATLSHAWGQILRMPSAHNAMLFALEDACAPPMQIILRGAGHTIDGVHQKLRQHAPIRSSIFAIRQGETGLPSILEERDMPGKTVAFVCQGFSCLEPFLDMDKLVRYLQSTKAV